MINHLCDYHDIKDVFIEMEVVTTLKHSEYLNYINSLANKYSLEDLLQILKRVEVEQNKPYAFRIHDIIKGKRIYDNPF